MHTGDVKDPRSEVGVFPLGKLKESCHIDSCSEALCPGDAYLYK